MSLLLAGGCDIVVGIKAVPQPPPSDASDGMPDGGLPPCGLISMLADDFEDNDLDALWPSHSSATEGNGVVTLDAASTTYAQITSQRFFDFRNGSFSAKIDTSSTFDASTEINLYMDSRKPNYNLRIRRTMSGFTFYRKENGSENVIGTKPYDNDRYWKIANNNGVAEFSLSADGTVYTPAATVPGLSYIDLMSPTFSAFRSSGGPPLTVTIDDVNGGAPSGIACPARTLTDNFDGTTIGEQWVRSHTNNNGALTESNGYADLSLPMSSSDVVMVGPTFFDLRDDQFVIEVPQNVATSSTNTFSMQVQNVAKERIELYISGTEMRGWQYSNSNQFPHGSGTFVPGTQVWFRFRSSGNFIYWEMSPDGIDWGTTPFGSTNDFTGLDRVELILAVEGNGSAPGNIHVDNWNLLPP